MSLHSKRCRASAACSWQLEPSGENSTATVISIRTVLCSESEGCWWGQRLSQDVVICILAVWSGSRFEENDPNSLRKTWTQFSWSLVTNILAEATDSHRTKKHVVAATLHLQSTAACDRRSTEQVFTIRALAHTSSCRFMSGRQHTQCPFLCVSQCFYDKSNKSINHFFAVEFYLAKKQLTPLYFTNGGNWEAKSL